MATMPFLISWMYEETIPVFVLGSRPSDNEDQVSYCLGVFLARGGGSTMGSCFAVVCNNISTKRSEIFNAVFCS
jgi:hypothetical protein